MSTRPSPSSPRHSRAFITLEAAATGQAALAQLLSEGYFATQHVVVRGQRAGQWCFYSFERVALITRLQRLADIERANAPLWTLLDLQASNQSQVVSSDESSRTAGALIVRGREVIGFVAPHATTWSMTPAALDDIFSTGSVQRGYRGKRDASTTEQTRGGGGFPTSETSDGYCVRSDEPASSLPDGFEDAPPLADPLAAAPRYFNARAPQQVQLGAQTYVIVQVAIQAATASADTSAGAAEVGNFVGTLTIDVHAPGLKATGETTLTLQVPVTGNSASVRFGFVAHRPGVQQVDVMAWNGSAQVAGVTLQIAVDTAPLAADASAAQGDMDMRDPQDGEYTLDVAMDNDTRRYRFQLRSDLKDVWPPMHSEPLLHDRQVTYNAMVANLNAQARNLYALSQTDQALWLKGLGNMLCEQLVPDKLKVLLIEHKSRIKVLNILSDADPTPWELLFLANPETGEGDFLAESATVARWRYGAPPCRALKRSNNVLVLPAGAPSAALAELDELKTLFGQAITIDNLSGLNALLSNGGFDLLHFAAHNVNVPGAQGGAYVPFGNQRWDLTFMGAVPQNRFKSTLPLVFMNACTSSGTTPLYTDLAGWADRFLRCGSGAFIGALWEVRDDSARQFSLVFYRELVAGKTLGDAMRSARSAVRAANPGDPTALAYTLYGNPLARFESEP